jgi:hypothetical protein
MVLMALSRFVVFKSCIFVFAISSILAREIVPTFSLFGLPEPFDAACLLQQIGGGRRLRLKGKRAIREHRYHHRNLQVRVHLRRLRVEGFAELHDIDAVLTERGQSAAQDSPCPPELATM